MAAIVGDPAIMNPTAALWEAPSDT